MLAASCAGASSEQPQELAFASDPVTLTLWGWEGTGHDLLIEKFEQDYPDIEVDVRISGFDQHHEGLAAALANGIDVPDVALIERAYMPDFAATPDDFIDLFDHGAGDRRADYLGWRWSEGVGPDGEVLGIPTDVGGLAIAYRTDLLAEAGLPTEPDEVGQLFASWESFLDAGRRFAESGSDAAFIDGPDSIFNARAGQAPTTYFDHDGAAIPGGSDGLAEAWRLSVESIDQGLVGGFRQFSPEWSEAMAADGFAALAAPSWIRGYIAGVAPETQGRWALAPLPGVAGNWGGSQMTIPAAAEHPEEAWLLVRHLTGLDAQLELFLENGNFPSTPELYEHPEIAGLADPLFGGQAIGPIYIESLIDLPGQPTGPGQRKMKRAFIDRLFEVEAGQDAETAWNDAVAEIETIAESAAVTASASSPSP